MEYVQAGLNTTTNDSTVNIFGGMFVVTWRFQVVYIEELSNVFLVCVPTSQKALILFFTKGFKD